MNFLVLSVLLASLASSTLGHIGLFHRRHAHRMNSAVDDDDDDPGEPLFLTPYLNEGRIDEARRMR